MSTEKTKTPIDVVGLRERLSTLTYDKLKEEAGVLGVSEAWKGGINKQTAVENIIKAYVEKSENTEIVSESLGSEESIPVGEYDIDEETLVEFPSLVEKGFQIGDVLVVEEGKPWRKKFEGDIISETLNSETLNSESVDSSIEEIEVIGEEYVPEVIDETLFSEEEILENIVICEANCNQALPETRLILLRKIDALTLALERKQKKE